MSESKPVALSALIVGVWRGISIVLVMWGIGYSVAAVSLQNHFPWHDLLIVWGGVILMIVSLAIAAALLLWWRSHEFVVPFYQRQRQ